MALAFPAMAEQADGIRIMHRVSVGHIGYCARQQGTGNRASLTWRYLDCRVVIDVEKEMLGVCVNPPLSLMQERELVGISTAFDHTFVFIFVLFFFCTLQVCRRRLCINFPTTGYTWRSVKKKSNTYKKKPRHSATSVCG